MYECNYISYLLVFCINFRTIVKTSETTPSASYRTSSSILQTNFVISADILRTDFDIFNNLPMCLYTLY